VNGSSRFVAVNPYHFLAETNDFSTRAAMRRIAAYFRSLKEGGFAGVLWSASVSGMALHHTRVGTPFGGDPRRLGRLVEAIFREVDVLEAACAAARDATLEILADFRLYDDYFPGLGSRFEAAHQEMLWESRCGEFRLRGVLSLAYETVYSYRLQALEEVAGYTADGVVIDLDTCVAPLTPFRRRDFFGFNAPIADTHRSRTGEDIRAFDDVRYGRGPDLQIVDAEYVGGAFNRAIWHAVKGASLERFLSAASKMLKNSGRRVGFLRGRDEGILPMARMKLSEDKWLADGIVDDVFLARGAGEDKDTAVYLAAKRPGSRIISGANEDVDGSIVDYRELQGNQGD